MLFKWTLLLYINSVLTEGGWRYFQWLSSGSLKSCPISIIVRLHLLLVIAFWVQWRMQPGRILFTSLLFYHHMFSNSLSLCFPIWKTTIKKLAKTWDLQLKISEYWFDFCLSCPVLSCCQGNDLSRETAPLHMLGACFSWKDSQLLVVYPSAILPHLPPFCLTKGRIGKDSTKGKYRKGKEKRLIRELEKWVDIFVPFSLSK